MGINLKNFIWNRDSQEAMDHPYEWDAQKKFVKEANQFLREIRKHLIEKHSFTKNDRSPKKAIWMLSLTALDSGIEITSALKRNQIQVIYHLLRSIQEALDLATFFSIQDNEPLENLKKWYDGGFVSHKTYRDYLGKKGQKEKKEYLIKIHVSLSSFNHNTYPTLQYSYGLDSEGYIQHYGRYDSGITIPANTISMLHAISANIILNLAFQLTKIEILDLDKLLEFIGDQNKRRIVKRKFEIKKRLIRDLD